MEGSLQGFGDPHQAVDRDVFLAALDSANIDGVQLGLLGQLLLADADLLPLGADVLAEPSAVLRNGCHACLPKQERPLPATVYMLYLACAAFPASVKTLPMLAKTSPGLAALVGRVVSYSILIGVITLTFLVGQGCGSSSSSGPGEAVLKTPTEDAIRACMRRVLVPKQAEEVTEVNCKITNLQRGEPFTDPGLRDVPSNHKVFPLRLMVEGTVKQPNARVKEVLEQKLDAPSLMEPVGVQGQIELKLYQDAFGVWQVLTVNPGGLKFRVDQGQWEPAPQ